LDFFICTSFKIASSAAPQDSTVSEDAGIENLKYLCMQVSPLQGDTFSMAGCMGMLLIDALIYGILTWSVSMYKWL
jgi:hypothetical protein